MEQTSGTINKIFVTAGDVVTAGQVLVSLDTTDLERALARSQIAVDTAVNKQAQTAKPATATELAASEAKLASAKAALIDAKTPPSAAEIAAAQSSLVAAQAKYNDLAKGPTQDKLTQLQADIKKKMLDLGIAVNPTSPAGFTGFVREQVAALAPAVKGAGVKL